MKTEFMDLEPGLSRPLTSPLGQHLGIYKSQAKHFPPAPKDKTNPEPFPDPLDPLQCSSES